MRSQAQEMSRFCEERENLRNMQYLKKYMKLKNEGHKHIKNSPYHQNLCKTPIQKYK